jgi:hypothetical protein
MASLLDMDRVDGRSYPSMVETGTAIDPVISALGRIHAQVSAHMLRQPVALFRHGGLLAMKSKDTDNE